MGCAALWALFIVAASFFIQSYSSSTSVVTSGDPNSSRTITSGGLTLVQVNGLKVLLPILIPLVCVAIVALCLWRRERRRQRGAGILAWAFTGLVAAVCVVGALTIGPFLAPIALFLFAATVRVHDRPPLNVVAHDGLVTTPQSS